MGEVYRARDTRLQRDVAIKISGWSARTALMMCQLQTVPWSGQTSPRVIVMSKPHVCGKPAHCIGARAYHAFMDHDDRQPEGPWWQPSRIDVGRRRALIGLSGVVMAALSSTRTWAYFDSRVALAQGGQRPGSCVLTPEAGEGPFYLDPKLIRSDITSGQAGAPLQLALQVVRAGDCATLANARVDVWHADAVGLYSGYERQSGVGGISTKAAVGQQYLRGTQVTDASGSVQFRTIFPSWYGGRTPHVHFKVFLGGNEVVASQIFFPDEITKEVFSQFQPYREHASKRTTFNNNDPIKQGVYSDVTRQSKSYAAKAVLVVATR